MTSVLLAGTPTLQVLSTGNETRVDQAFTSETLRDEIIKCNTRPEDRPTKVDHYPILMEVSCTIDWVEPPQRRNFRKADWEEVKAKLEEELKDLE